MADQQFLQDVIELGQHLKGLGGEWKKYLPRLRDAVKAIRDGTGGIDAEYVTTFRQALGLDKGMQVSVACPRCEPPLPGHWNGRRTQYVLPDRHTTQCAKCGTVWVVMDKKSAANS